MLFLGLQSKILAVIQRVVSQGLLPLAGWGCVHAGHAKVEVNPLVTFFVPGGVEGGHTLFGRMQTPRLMDGHSDCFPGFRFIREIVTQPLGEAEERAGLPSALAWPSPGSRMPWRGWEFSCLGRAVRRGGVNLPQQLSSLQPRAQRCRVVHKRHIWCNQKHRLFASLMLDQIHTSHTLPFKQVCHQG